MLALGPFKMTVAFGINSFILSTFIFGSYFIHQKSNQKVSDLFLIFAWVSFEYLHLNWQLSFPILMHGHHLAIFPQLIQWYEYTGALGGTLWILSINVLLMWLFQSYHSLGAKHFVQKQKTNFLIFFALLFLPSIWSVWKYQQTPISGEEVEVVSLHSNLDCRSEKYKMDQQELLDYYWEHT